MSTDCVAHEDALWIEDSAAGRKARGIDHVTHLVDLVYPRDEVGLAAPRQSSGDLRAGRGRDRDPGRVENNTRSRHTTRIHVGAAVRALRPHDHVVLPVPGRPARVRTGTQSVRDEKAGWIEDYAGRGNASAA